MVVPYQRGLIPRRQVRIASLASTALLPSRRGQAQTWIIADMPTPALEWLQRRAEGESVASIASRAGVPVAAVRRATDPYGPWSRDPSGGEHAGRRQRRWIAMRRKGVSVREIAQRDGVSHQMVSRWTRDAGPFPKPGTPSVEQVQSWVTARRAGQSIQQIARSSGVPTHRVSAAIKPYGPFPRRSQRIPAGIYCRNDIATLIGVAGPTIATWYSQGFLPPPDFIISRSRPIWLPATIERWIPTSGLIPCPICGVLSRRPESHSAAHRRPQRRCVVVPVCRARDHGGKDAGVVVRAVDREVGDLDPHEGPLIQMHDVRGHQAKSHATTVARACAPRRALAAAEREATGSARAG